MIESVDVAIVGGGQAGPATSWYLKQAGVDHVVLEAGRVAESKSPILYGVGEDVEVVAQHIVENRR